MTRQEKINAWNKEVEELENEWYQLQINLDNLQDEIDDLENDKRDLEMRQDFVNEKKEEIETKLRNIEPEEFYNDTYIEDKNQLKLFDETN